MRFFDKIETELNVVGEEWWGWSHLARRCLRHVILNPLVKRRGRARVVVLGRAGGPGASPRARDASASEPPTTAKNSAPSTSPMPVKLPATP